LRAPHIDILGQERADQGELLARARDRDIQPALAALLVERAKVHQYSPRPIAPVADADNDHIALVALHIFQIFHEERLGARLVEERAE
jgi:hypothetical protein